MAEYTPPGHKLVENPKISVCITTYNHEKYIAEALDSVLMQETDFPFEIIVGEDESSDGTREICKQYKERYPDRIRLFLNSRENVIYIEGLATGRWNMLNNIEHARGGFVALLEGDDYWTDVSKLDLQVKLLDSRPDLSFCFHKAWVKDPEPDKKACFHEEFSSPQNLESCTADLFFRWFVPTASVVFRRSMLPEFPGWYRNSISGDHGLQLLLSTRGNFVMLDRYMSTYRRHPGGLSNHLRGGLHLRNWYQMHHQFNRMLGFKYDQELAYALNSKLRGFAFVPWENHGDFRRSISELLQSLRYARKLGTHGPFRSIARAIRWLLFHVWWQIRSLSIRAGKLSENDV